MKTLVVASIAAFAFLGGIGSANAEMHGGGFHGGGFHGGGGFHDGGRFHGSRFHDHFFHGHFFHDHSHGRVFIRSPRSGLVLRVR